MTSDQYQMEYSTDDEIMENKAEKQFEEIQNGERLFMSKPVQEWLNRKNSVFNAQRR